MARKNQTSEGTLVLTSQGFGFVHGADGPDVFVDRDHLGTALEGDRVTVEVFRSSSRRRPAGRIVGVIERSTRPIVGLFRRTRQGGELYPENDRVVGVYRVEKVDLKRAGLTRQARNNTVVSAVLKQWDEPSARPVAEVKEVIGTRDEPGIDLKIIARSRGLSLEFPDDVIEETQRLTEPNMKKARAERVDLTDRQVFTIDPEDAGDLDDALSVRQRDDGLFEVGVHIADVSAFVAEGSSIDREARRRATSVYFVQDVLPMLPERISNDLCSLTPNKARLAHSVLIVLDSRGEVHEVEVVESVIRSRHRLSYEEAEAVLAGRQHPIASALHQLQLIAGMLRAKREAAGSIDFDLPAPVITLDADGIPEQVRRGERLEAQRLIEELMLLANRSIASTFGVRRRGGVRPFVFRVHERPKPEDVATIRTVLRNLGIPLDIEDELTPQQFQRILDIVESLELQLFAEKVALRSMTKAFYSTENQGHFGLAFKAYTHFTSPIRRYADLTVHRLVKRYASGNRKVSRSESRQLAEIAAHCGEMERLAIDAERAYRKRKAMEFLSTKVGRNYAGVISGVSRGGVFVELVHYQIEGMVPRAGMNDDQYLLDQENFQFIGQDTGTVYRIGDRVRVRIVEVDVNQGKAYFEFTQNRRQSRTEESA